MNSHELARQLLAHPNGPLECSVDLSSCDENAHLRAFGEFVEVNYFVNEVGFGSDHNMLLFYGGLNCNIDNEVLVTLCREYARLVIAIQTEFKIKDQCHESIKLLNRTQPGMFEMIGTQMSDPTIWANEQEV